MSTQDTRTDGESTETKSAESTETGEPMDLPEYHCVAAVAETSSPHAGEVHKVVFDPEVLDKWVYRELLDVIEADGYELVSFGVIEDVEEAEFFTLPEEYVMAPIGVFVYRGANGGEA